MPVPCADDEARLISAALREGVRISKIEGQRMADVGGIAVDQLRSIVERIERLEEEKANITADVREVYAEAKGNGYDVKALRQQLYRPSLTAAF